MSHQSLKLGARDVAVRLSSSAAARLPQEREALDFEMELYFSCLIRKRVHVRSERRGDVAARAALTPAVTVSFRPVVGRPGALCDVAEAPLDSIPLARPAAFTPKWLTLDYRAGRWSGEFGF